VRHERAGLDARDRLADVGVEIAEGLGRPRRPDAGVRLDGGLEVVIGKGEHPAVGVVDKDDLPGAEQPLADGQGADLVIGNGTSRVADHMRVAFGQAKNGVHIEPGVHTGNDRNTARGPQRQVTLKRLRVALVVLE
jgi:hypothetical protein